MYLRKSLPDGKDDEIPNSPTDFTEPPKTGSRLGLTIVVIMIIAFSIAVFYGGYKIGYYDELFGSDDGIFIQDIGKCEAYLEEAQDLVEFYNGDMFTMRWAEVDAERIDELKEKFSNECEPNKNQVLEKNLQSCTILYISILSLIDKMEDMVLETLDKKNQDRYNESYQTYHDLDCSKIKTEIENTDKFRIFNGSRTE